MQGWICKTIVDLNEDPIFLPSFDYSYNPIRASQLLFGEKIEVLDESERFYKIQALEQPYFSSSWHSYLGWIRKDAVLPLKNQHNYNLTVSKSHALLHLGNERLPLSFGTCLCGENILGGWKIFLPDNRVGFCEKQCLRPLKICLNDFIHDAQRFLGAPYLFGGRGAYLPHRPFAASVDCSGLVSLLFRAQGIVVPRDAHDQYLKAKKRSSLQTGDLIFLRPIDKTRISHVMAYLGEDTFIEAPQSGKSVQLLKKNVSMVANGENIFTIRGRQNRYIAEYGSFIDTFK